MPQSEPRLNPQSSTSRIIPISEVVARTSLSRRTVYNLIGKDKFPPPIQLSVRRVGWREDAVDQWIEQRSKVGAAA